MNDSASSSVPVSASGAKPLNWLFLRDAVSLLAFACYLLPFVTVRMLDSGEVAQRTTGLMMVLTSHPPEGAVANYRTLTIVAMASTVLATVGASKTRPVYSALLALVPTITLLAIYARPLDPPLLKGIVEVTSGIGIPLAIGFHVFSMLICFEGALQRNRIKAVR